MFKLNDKLFLVLLSSFFLSLFVVLQVYPYLLSLRIEVPILILNTLNTKVVFFIVHHSLSILSHLMSLSVLLITQNSICVSLSLSLSLLLFVNLLRFSVGERFSEFEWQIRRLGKRLQNGFQSSMATQSAHLLSLSLPIIHTRVGDCKVGKRERGRG